MLKPLDATTGSATVEQPEITFIATYTCPRCQASLEAKTSESYTWLRCPKCGRASLPPEHTRVPPSAQPPLGDDVLIIGPESDPRGFSQVGRPQAGAHPGGARRVALAVGLLLSLAMLLIAFMEQNEINVFIFGLVSIVLFAFLGLSGRRG